MKTVSHINGGRHFILIFHFRFGQGRAAIQTELHRLGTAIQITGLINLTQRAHGIGFGFEVHGQIRIVPIAQHAQADKIAFLLGNLLGGVFAAQPTETRHRHILAVQFFHHHFNRQAVAVPTRHIRRIEARQRFAAHDDVFQDFIDRMTDMNIAVGIGRAVVQNKFRPAGSFLAQLLVAFLLVPAFQPSRLALGQVAAHRKRGIEKIDGLSVVGHGRNSEGDGSVSL